MPQELADAIAQYVRVVGLASQIASPTGVTPVTNNVGQQALLLAQQIQTDLTALQAKTVSRRSVVVYQNIPSGDSLQDFVFTPAMPDAAYQVYVEIGGSATHPSTYYGWRLVRDSKTTTGFQLSFDNMPNNSVISVSIEANQNVEA